MLKGLQWCNSRGGGISKHQQWIPFIFHFKAWVEEMQSSSFLLFPPTFFFFKGRWKEWSSKEARLTPVSMTAQARKIVGKDLLAAIWNSLLPDLQALTDGAAFCSHMVEHLEGLAKRCWCQHWEGEPSHYWKPDLGETATNRKFCFMLDCFLCARDPVWNCRKARPCLTAWHSSAEPCLEGKASFSAHSPQCEPFTVQHFPLCTHSLTPSLFLFTQIRLWVKLAATLVLTILLYQEDKVCSSQAATET